MAKLWLEWREEGGIDLKSRPFFLPRPSITTTNQEDSYLAPVSLQVCSRRLKPHMDSNLTRQIPSYFALSRHSHIRYLMKFWNDKGEVFLFWRCLKMILQPCGYCSRVVVTKKLRFLPCWFSTLILLVCLHFTNQCVKRYLWSVKFCQNQRFSTLCLDKALSIKEWQRFHLLPFHGEKAMTPPNDPITNSILIH